MKNTLVVNLFGEPGAGKSTGAAYVFAMLKMAGVDAELVTEYAKDKVWESNTEVFKNQMYILGKQSLRQSRCNGKVDVIVTDSPLPLSILYVEDAAYTENYCKTVMDVFGTYNNINFLLKRFKPYNANGRNQSEEEAKVLSEKVYKLLKDNNIPYECVEGTLGGYTYIYETVYSILKERDNG